MFFEYRKRRALRLEEEISREIRLRSWLAGPDGDALQGRLQLNQKFKKLKTSDLRERLGYFLEKLVFGKDDRTEIADAPPYVKQRAPAVVAIVNYDDLVDDPSTQRMSLGGSVKNFGYCVNFCSEEPFLGQPVPAFGSGFLIGQNYILTAAHCFNGTPKEKIRFLLGFQLTGNTATTTFDYRDVLSGEVEMKGDCALVKLSSAVTHVTPLACRSDGGLSDVFYAIGHPSGLPKKYSGEGKLGSGGVSSDSFWATLDTSKSSSGSPVFGKNSGLVEGVLQEEIYTDFIVDETRGCLRSRVLAETETGQRVSRCSRDISVLVNALELELH